MANKNKGISRRAFFRSAGAAGLGAMMAGPGGLHASPAGAAAVMPKRVFGKTGVKVSLLSLGGMFDIPNNQIVLKQALALGVTYWDTANSYSGGNSEVGIGQFFARNPGVREKIFLVSKSTNRSAAGMSEHLELSLKRLQTSYVDLYFVHSVTDIKEMTPELLKWGQEAKASGKIKYFGFSTHRNMAACLAGAAKLDGIDGIMTTFNYRCLGDKDMLAAMEACSKRGIGLTAMKTMGEGPSPVFSSGDMDLVERFQKKRAHPGAGQAKSGMARPAHLGGLRADAQPGPGADQRGRGTGPDQAFGGRPGTAGGVCPSHSGRLLRGLRGDLSGLSEPAGPGGRGDAQPDVSSELSRGGSGPADLPGH